jgi:hypothetical protein
MVLQVKDLAGLINPSLPLAGNIKQGCIVQGDSSFTARTINPIKKLVKIMKRGGYIPFI